MNVLRTDKVTVVVPEEGESLEDAVLKTHILVFRIMQHLTQTYGIDMETARELCAMTKEQLPIMMQVILEAELTNNNADEDMEK